MNIIFGLSEDIEDYEISQELLNYVNSKWDVSYIAFPESMLHPKKQKAILDDLINYSPSKGITQDIYIKTTSQFLIEYAGQLIEDGVLSDSDVTVVIAKYIGFGAVDITEYYFNSDGYFENWPIGFFSGGEIHE